MNNTRRVQERNTYSHVRGSKVAKSYLFRSVTYPNPSLRTLGLVGPGYTDVKVLQGIDETESRTVVPDLGILVNF
ncbi:hypothetical protein DCAR_0102150 [Daucus carota subsp. sativus]|uniref:Uncharacterized protein n=1 Tax=Daucus carota subsp. sativus TaxID=79200 RepID=A0A166GX11_DAUCS|nr:hypothetical protein DCAR_0102150 [Daucus carota subsp. sativus]